mmetsp:Transcript_73540/g.192893  ORF Transcript_73540/g.192893 Transcript_73540/m.192893 type:complete len:223 (+) Transcript_73540:639-1307(+)
MGHRLRQGAHLLLHLQERLGQRVRQGAAGGLLRAEGVEARRQLRVSAGDEVRVGVGREGHHVLLAGLAQRHDVGVEHDPEARPQEQLQRVQVGVQAVDLSPLHALPVELDDADHQEQPDRVPAVRQEGLQRVQEELRGLAEHVHEERVVPVGVEEVAEEQELGRRCVHEQHLVAAEQLLVVVFHLVLVQVGDDRVLLQLLQDGVPAGQGEDIALVLELGAAP